MMQDREALVRENEQIRAALNAAFEQSAQGNVVYLGDFSQYAN